MFWLEIKNANENKLEGIITNQLHWERKGNGKETGTTQGRGEESELMRARQVYKWVQCFSNSEGLCE